MDMEAMARLVEDMTVEEGQGSSSLGKDTCTSIGSAHTIETKIPEESKAITDQVPETSHAEKIESTMPVGVEVDSVSQKNSALYVEVEATVAVESESKPSLEQVSDMSEKTELELSTHIEGDRDQEKDVQVARDKSSDTDVERKVAGNQKELVRANQGEKGIFRPITTHFCLLTIYNTLLRGFSYPYVKIFVFFFFLKTLWEEEIMLLIGIFSLPTLSLHDLTEKISSQLEYILL